MSFTVVVPARLAATRLPNKPLADLGGQPMLVRVLEQAQLSGACRVIAATDADEIVHVVTKAGFEAVRTPACANGTERVAQAAKLLKLDGVIVNLQGDVPSIDPQLIATVAERAAENDCDCATAAGGIEAELATSTSVVKVVCDHKQQAMYFSRTPIPSAAPIATYLGHIGIYAFAPGKLHATLTLPPCGLEEVERLEQLRWLWHGWNIAVVTAEKFFQGIDTPADLAAAEATYS